MGKVSAIRTSQGLKEHVNGAGLLCLKLHSGDFVAIGASVFVGVGMIHENQVTLAFVSPSDQIIQRYQFTPEPTGKKLEK
jgi:hypothetical protein